MDERRASPRHRTLLGGKIVFNSGQSAINCTVRNLSAEGACLQVETPFGIPDRFYLISGGGDELRACRIAWRSSDRVGVLFEQERSADGDPDDSTDPAGSERVSAEMQALRAALNEVAFGVVLLDQELRAQFINHAFRKIWRLPDAKADSRPPFVALMYQGRDTRAYDVPVGSLDHYVAERVAHVKAGNPTPIDIRLSNGEVLRFQCMPLPGGGRMLSYTYVTDIVRHADELEVLRAALDRVRDGIVLLDPGLNAQFLNRSVRQLWKISDEQAERRPNIAELVGDAKWSGTYAVDPDQLPAFIERRLAQIRSGDPVPTDLHTSDGRIIRAQCARLPSGGRMLTYCDVTDLVRNAEKLEAIATTDSTTGLFNRRHFLSLAELEWSRFQRYHRPLSMLIVDVDHFKSVNDRFGHDVGDAALIAVAKMLQLDRRSSDVVCRFGGDEFMLLLPETAADNAGAVAGRLCATIAGQPIGVGTATLQLSVSIGVATATAGMSGTAVLIKLADEALYAAKTKGRNRVEIARPMSCPTNVAAE